MSGRSDVGNNARTQPAGAAPRDARPLTRGGAGDAAVATTFDFSSRMRDLCADIAGRVPELSHVDMHRVAVGFARCRKPAAEGLQATLTPLRFEGGRLVSWKAGRLWTIQRVTGETGLEVLYILTFYLPRFMNLPLDEKLVTIFHELWHISPEFNGDLRRFAGRCHVHSASEKEYDLAMARLARRWLDSGPPEAVYEFLHGGIEQLLGRYRKVVGMRFPQPRLIPL